MAYKKFWKQMLWEVLATILTLGLNQIIKEKGKEGKEDPKDDSYY